MSRIPSNNDDEVLRLHAHYVEAADLMWRQFHKLDKERQAKGRLSRGKMVDWYQYWKFWLATLYVVVEGFHALRMENILRMRGGKFVELIPKCRDLERATAQHKRSLRDFRNGAFHFQRNPKKLSQFLTQRRLRSEWAEELHLDLARFFSRYRGVRLFAYLEETGLWDP